MAEARIERFTRTERAAHWVQAASFIALLLTGFALMSPQIEGWIGHRALLREIHLSGAFFLFFGPAVVSLAGNRHSVARDVEDVDRWDADDLRWLIPSPIRRIFGMPSPPQGRFNAGQKLNAIFVAWSTLTFAVSGLIMWQNRRFPLDLVQNANAIHTALAYVALVAFLGHLSLATWYPTTRHALRAMVSGWVRSDWARQHHRKWAQSAPARFDVPRFDGVRATIELVVGSFIALFAVRIFFFWLGANPTDAVTRWLYDVTAWPGVAAIAPATGARILDWPAAAYLLLLLVAWRLTERTRRVAQPVGATGRGSRTATHRPVTRAGRLDSHESAPPRSPDL